MKKQLLILLAFLTAYNITRAQSFITTWNTLNSGTSNPTSITIPTFPGETYNYDVDWDNDGAFDEFGITGDVTHNFGVAGVYNIRIAGNFPRIYFNDQGDKNKILSVEQWGNLQWTSMESAFFGCTNLEINATDAPDLSNVTSLVQMFMNASAFNQNISNWNTSNVTNMSRMFSNATAFNQNIGNWDTSNVTTMFRMFENATAFNQQLNDWETGNVTNMSDMFNGATSFNRNINNWDTSNVEFMNGMFENATAYNHALNNWDTSSVTQMVEMFRNASSFNQDISSWNTINVTAMSRMFTDATNFNQPLNSWDTGNVTNMSFMFEDASSFNQDIGNWNTSNVTSIANMFRNASSFNQNINNWDVSGVTSLIAVFQNATSFNQPLNNWDTSGITTMFSTFNGASSFNQPLNNWNTSNVTTMRNMFRGATSFNQNIGAWDISNVVNMDDMFLDATLSVLNYDNILNGWGTLDAGETQIPSVITFNGGNSQYCLAETTRNLLTSPLASGGFGWTITDNGIDCSVQEHFVTTWLIEDSGGFDPPFISIPTHPGETYNYDVDWDNDGVFDEFGITGNITHSYSVLDIGTQKTIRITGVFPHIWFNNSGDKDKIISVDQWGTQQWSSFENAFTGCENIEINAIDAPDLSNATNVRFMFRGASMFNQNINHWNVTNITDMTGLFFDATSFNQDLGNWDTGNVSIMTAMFFNAVSFNQDISSWDTSNVTNMSNMFESATAFDQNLGDWNVSNVTSMSDMLTGTTLSTENYDNTLIGWDSQALQNDLSFHGGNSTYCNGETARNNIVADHNWTITDGGLDCSGLGVNSFNQNTIQLYPNPVEDKIFIKGLSNNPTVEITDLTGKLILQTNDTEFENGLDVSSLKAAVYFIKVTEENKVTVMKFIKQ